MLTLKAGTATFTADNDSLFIPASDLTNYGLVDGDCTDDTTGYCKILDAIFRKLADPTDGLASVTGLLGLTALTQTSILNSNTNGVILYSTTFSLTGQTYNDISLDLTGEVVPVPTSGANTGIGKLDLTAIFSGAAKVAAAASTGSAGLLVEYSSLTAEDADDTYTNLTLGPGEDNRLTLINFFRSYTAYFTTRDTANSVQSAVTAATRSAGTTIAIPAAYTATTDPTSDLDGTKPTGHYQLISQTFNTTIQYSVDKAGTQQGVYVA